MPPQQKRPATGTGGNRKGFDMNESPRMQQMPEVPEDLLDEIAAGGNRPGSNAVTPPDPFVQTPHARSDR